VEALPWISVVRIVRRWPNRIEIVVAERTPEAAVALQPMKRHTAFGSVALVDADLRVLAVEPSADAQGLVLFRITPPLAVHPAEDMHGTGVEQAYEALVQLRALGLQIAEVSIAPSTGIGVATTSGLHVIFGSTDDLANKVALYDAIQPKLGAPRNVVYVDLRSVRAPTVLYR
jgi:cell division septal protein FtsQ